MYLMSTLPWKKYWEFGEESQFIHSLLVTESLFFFFFFVVYVMEAKQIPP